MGQRPARCERRSRREADAGCRNPSAAAISNRHPSRKGGFFMYEALLKATPEYQKIAASFAKPGPAALFGLPPAGVSELQIKNTLSAIDAQSATTTTAASGGNREELLGQRPARRECRPRHDADAGCRNPIAAGIQKRFTCPPAAPPARLSGRGDGSLPRQRSRPRAARTGRWRSPRPGGRADSAAPARPAWRFPADGR